MLLGILLAIHIIVCIALIGVILLQRSEGGALGMGGGNSFMTARGTGDLLTKTTQILAAAFFGLSLLLTILSGHAKQGSSVTDQLKVQGIDLNALQKQQQQNAQRAAQQQQQQQQQPPVGGAQPLQAPTPQLAPARPAAAPAQAPAKAASPLSNVTIDAKPRPQELPRPNVDKTNGGQ
ncbi:preprotein translocase subunit SecG [Caulobacter sp. CCUG 60055]|uniref:preprotein translocase subunit SecG n=1 Tax=Caulobacter sp. CCUG 60055 TaxID=2100090 RepID=UPI001FA7B9FA|nr:preprotein translocase subunit SecG [Caulobacter sp. CCUG 60055]MBQ1540615.1 preprotein translocase subunit SecG [Caulobacteraceae bacterium]MCI3178858.1 preprotein translocase subunit SecG [Caulobacter sp. CCUG 60055]